MLFEPRTLVDDEVQFEPFAYRPLHFPKEAQELARTMSRLALCDHEAGFNVESC